MLLTDIGMQLWLLVLGIGIWNLLMETAWCGALLLGGCAWSFASLQWSAWRHRHPDTEYTIGLHWDSRFKAAKAKWCRKQTTAEYCFQFGKEKRHLTEAERAEVMDYAGYWIAYLTIWAAQRGYLSESFAARVGAECMEACKAETIEPAMLLRQMGYELRRDDFAAELHPFLDTYIDYGADRYLSAENIGTYWNDYCEAARVQRYAYCMPFSWQTCHRLSERIDEEYRFYRIQTENAQFSAESKAIGEDTLSWKAADANLHIFSDFDVADGKYYIEECKKMLISMDDAQLDALGDALYAALSAREGISLPQTDEKDVHHRGLLRACGFSRMNIFLPYGEAPALTLGGNPDFAKEDGIGVVLREGKVLQVGTCADTEQISPWSYVFEVPQKDAESEEKFEKSSCQTQTSML